MLVEFAIDPEAILELGRLERPRRREVSRRLLKLWALHGFLVIPGATPRILEEIKRLPQDVRKDWEEALVQHRPRTAQGLPCLSTVHCESDLAPFRQVIDVASLDAVRAMELGLTDDDDSRSFEGDVEVCRFESTDLAKAFEAAELSSREPIAAEFSVSDLWRDRFRKLAASAKNIVIVDRYALSGVLPETQTKQSGLTRLLSLIDQSSKQAKVEIIGEEPEYDPDLQIVIQRLTDHRHLLRNRGVSELHLLTVPRARAWGEKFANLSHGRYVRFGNRVVTLDIGVDVFSGTHTPRLCQVGMTMFPGSYRDAENALRHLARGVLIA